MSGQKDRIGLVERRLDELEETIEILGNKNLLRSIERGLKDLQKGRCKKYATVDELFRDIKSST